MLNRLLREFYKSPNNGRQVVGLPGGHRLLITHSKIMGPAGVQLRRSMEDAPERLPDFDHVVELIGPAGVIPDGGEWGFGASAVVTDGAVHVAWTGENGIAYSTAPLHGLDRAWSPMEYITEGNVQLGDVFVVDGVVHVTTHRIRDRHDESVNIAWRDGHVWHVREVHRGGPMFAPVADVDPDGRIHLAWADVAERLHYAVMDDHQSEPQVEQLGNGKQPSILATGDQVIIGCESQYPHIHYYFHDGAQWQRDRWVTWCHDWFMPDLVHSPQLAVDHHGVVWIFFADNTRKSTFWARWMGHAWGEITNGPRVFYRPPHFDANLLPIGRLSVEKRPSPRARDIGMLLVCEPPVDRIAYRRQVVPDLDAHPGRKVLFLDMLEVARTEHVEMDVQPARKHPANPLMERGPKGSFDQDRVFNHGTVLLDGGTYRMWYGGIRNPDPDGPAVPWWDWIRCGYAESEDGIHWKRVNVGQVEDNGSTDNNIVPYLRHSPVMIRDDADPDPQRRYKAFYFWNSGEMTEMAKTGKYGTDYDPRDEVFPVSLLTSPDGLNLVEHRGEVSFPGDQVKPFSAIPMSVFRDDADPDPAKRYKAYGFMSLNLRRRGTSYMYSPDGLHWTAHPEMPVIDPAVRGNPPAVGGPTGQVHDTVCFPYEGYYVALYQDQHDPEHMPIELAVSRDAETFCHVKPGQKVIPLGEPDAWDAEAVLASMPVITDDQIRIYYGGSTKRPVPPELRARFGSTDVLCLPGLATLRRDGFTAVHLARGRQQGLLETIPFELGHGVRRLCLNVACGAGASVRAEIVDAATGLPLPGYGADNCRPITDDVVSGTVSWASGPDLPAPSAPVRLRVHLQGSPESPRLYAFGFARDRSGRHAE